jgi:hypothetical protein
MDEQDGRAPSGESEKNLRAGGLDASGGEAREHKSIMLKS